MRTPVGTNRGPTPPSKIVCYSGNITVGSGVVVTMAAGTYVFTDNLDLAATAPSTERGSPCISRPEAAWVVAATATRR